MDTLSLLGVLFVGLKLAKIIDWSWWFVVAPFYAPLTIVGISWLVTAIGWFLVSLAASWWTRRQAKKQKERLKGHALKA